MLFCRVLEGHNSNFWILLSFLTCSRRFFILLETLHDSCVFFKKLTESLTIFHLKRVVKNKMESLR